MADLEDPQEMDDSVHQGFSRENAEDTGLGILHTQNSPPVDFGMKRDLMDTGGATHASSLSKFAFGMRKNGLQSPAITRPDDSPTKKNDTGELKPCISPRLAWHANSTTQEDEGWAAGADQRRSPDACCRR